MNPLQFVYSQFYLLSTRIYWKQIHLLHSTCPCYNIVLHTWCSTAVCSSAAPPDLLSTMNKGCNLMCHACWKTRLLMGSVHMLPWHWMVHVFHTLVKGFAQDCKMDNLHRKLNHLHGEPRTEFQCKNLTAKEKEKRKNTPFKHLIKNYYTVLLKMWQINLVVLLTEYKFEVYFWMAQCNQTRG